VGKLHQGEDALVQGCCRSPPRHRGRQRCL